MHKYPYLYQQCENTIGYDDMIKRLEKNQAFPIGLNVNCKHGNITLFIENTITEVYNELIDFLDGNGFIIKRVSNKIVYIIPIERKNME